MTQEELSRLLGGWEGNTLVGLERKAPDPANDRHRPEIWLDLQPDPDRPKRCSGRAALEEMIWVLEAGSGIFRQLKLGKARDVTPTGDSGVSDGLQYDPVSDLCYFTQASGGTPQLLAFRYGPAKE